MTALETPTKARAEDWLVGGGEMGELLRSMDWSKTALGRIDSWPQSLRTTVSLCLASNFPISLAWGPKHVQIYNDGYWPICGGKHPRSMGQDFTECWASAWPVIGEAYERALGGETSYLENQRMFLDRNGYLEETFFTFSFSPIRDETGRVGGLFHPVTETTGKMIGERRTRALRDLAARAGKAQSTAEALALAAQTLADFEFDLPFTLFYALDEGARVGRLVASTGLTGEATSPTPWPLREVAESGTALQILDLEARLGPLRCGPYDESARIALALPVIPPGCERPVAVLVAGVSPRLPLNDAYRAFLDLLAAGVTAAVANARAYELERGRAEALAEIDRAKTVFFSNVSHEFRTPLTLMLGPIEDELAERVEPLPAARRARLEAAHRNSLRLLKLVNSLLDFSRIEAGRIQASYEPVDLAAATSELASVFRSAIERAGLTFAVDCPALPETVYVDREMWEKIVLNLLSNALKHTFEGAIAVVLRWQGDRAELTVRDTGVGIPEAELPRLFERFHRVKDSRSRSHEGTGIGLALVQELCGLHGGAVSVESREGEGSAFVVTVRAGRGHLPEDRIGAARALASTATRSAAFLEEALLWLPPAAPAEAEVARRDETVAATLRPRVLWADDNADLRNYVAALLSSEYVVEAVADGREALEAARERKPDLVLSDVMMPHMDGFSLLRELRSDPTLRAVPVILLSARAGEESALEGLEAGADDYLSKPFSAKELLARVRTNLDLARLRREWADELEQVNRELESFSYSVSHDLRAPLRAMDGFATALLDEYSDRLDEGGRHCLRRIHAGAKRMSSLIEALLDLSRIQRAPLRRESVDLTALAREIASRLRSKDPARRVTLEIAEGLEARGDTRLLGIALENLMDNAWKFTGRNAEGWIAFGRDDAREGKPFFIRDNGVGFDMEFAGNLFGPFQRMHAESEFEGTGIGLATVRKVITRHGGRIWAESELARGTTFFFTLGETHDR